MFPTVVITPLTSGILPRTVLLPAVSKTEPPLERPAPILCVTVLPLAITLVLVLNAAMPMPLFDTMLLLADRVTEAPKLELAAKP